MVYYILKNTNTKEEIFRSFLSKEIIEKVENSSLKIEDLEIEKVIPPGYSEISSYEDWIKEYLPKNEENPEENFEEFVMQEEENYSENIEEEEIIDFIFEDDSI